MKVCLLHDFFNKRGGGEMLVLNLARALNADIYTGFVDEKNTYDEIKNFRVFEIGKSIKSDGLRTIYLMRKFSKLKLDYDFYIFSGTNCITAVDNNKPNILYCHTPPRFLYDLRGWFDKNTGFLGRLGLRALRWYVKPRDQACIRQFDWIVANSENVRQRLLKYYGKEVYEKSSVIYSIVDLNKNRYLGQSDFYLSMGRLDEFKRIDVIIEAFKKMPDKRLVVISSGPQLEKIKKLTSGYSNIEILGWVSEAKKAELLGKCIATIYIPMDEDMGLSVLESFSAGKPCVGANEGGVKELIDKRTGMLIEPSIDGVIDAVKKMTPLAAKSMKNNCLKKASMFTEKIFVNKIKKHIKEIQSKKS
ncbi:MAG: glycosyltransferase [Candidatus Aenigmarchaeota archaeon]|nr:glycosyltransferase [Candidatus Aenigmarchaeota archaeon]